MMNRFFYLLLACLLCISSVVYSRPIVFENQEIESIVIVPGIPTLKRTIDQRSALLRMKTKTGEHFSQNDFDADLKILSQTFERIEPILDSVNDKLQITLKVWPKANIRSITWEGNRRVQTERLKQKLGITPNSIFDRDTFTKAFHEVQAYYVKKGFYESELQYTTCYDPDTLDIDIVITIDEGRSGRIRELDFVNFTKKERKELREIILTKKWFFFTSWLTGEGTFQEEMAEQDRLIITHYLQNRGYANASVEFEICETPEKNLIAVKIIAHKGSCYHLGKVSFEGNNIFDDNKVRSLFTVKEGDIYSPEKLRQTVQKITNAYGNRGYIDALVTYEPQLQSQGCVYNVKFRITEGERYCVGLIKVFGNNSTETSVILHETRITPGEVFNTAKLQLTEQRLLNIGYFKNVNVYAVRSPGEKECEGNFRDVHIEVEETSTGSFSGFFAFSTADSILGGITLTERNFNHKGIWRVFKDGHQALRGGGEYAHLTTTIGKKQNSYVLSWTKPYFQDTQWIVGFEVEHARNRVRSDSYQTRSLGFVLHGKYPINQYLKYGIKYRLRDSKIDVFKDEEASLALKSDAKIDGTISALSASLIYDSTDNIISPTKGGRSRLEVEVAGIGTDRHTFWKLIYTNTFYQRLSSRGIAKIRADLRFIDPLGDSSVFSIPLDERLFLGGDTTVRGYDAYSIGPVYAGTNEARGGISSALLSWEYSHAIIKKIDGFFFTDLGQVSAKHFHFAPMRGSVGYGVRLNILGQGMPLTFGMGYPFNIRPGSNQEKRFFFSVGGRF